MGARVIQLPRFFMRTVLIVSTWVAGAAFAAYVPDEGAQRRAEELAPPAAAPANQPQNSPSHVPGARAGRPSEAPPLIDPPSPAPV